MERWSSRKGDKIENKKIDAFIEEVIAVSKKHGFSISHEDGHGAFEIEKFSESNASWLRHAADET
jgi:hypothetical protein